MTNDAHNRKVDPLDNSNAAPDIEDVLSWLRNRAFLFREPSEGHTKRLSLTIAVKEQDDLVFVLESAANAIERLLSQLDDKPTVRANLRLRARNAQLRRILNRAVDQDGGVSYDRFDDGDGDVYGYGDSIGVRSCCGVLSYKPHVEGCWVLDAKKALED